MVNNTMLPWTPILKYAVKERKPAEVQNYTDPDLDYLSQEYWGYDIITGAAELHKLQQLGLSLLGEIRSPVLTIISEKDYTVPVEVASLIHSRIASREKETLLLKESPHVVVNDCEKETAADAIIAWFNKPLS
jgi:carboxylesterase